MGACGCGELGPDFKLRGPENTIYFITIYTGCHYCDSPAGVIIEKATEESLKDHDEFELEYIPEVKFYSYNGKLAKENESGEFAIPLMLPQKFVEKLSKVCGPINVDGEKLDLYEVIDPIDYYSAMQESIYETLQPAYEVSKKIEEGAKN